MTSESKPQLNGSEVDARLRAEMAGLVGLPQLLRLPDGRVVDSYPYLVARKIDVIADHFPGWEERWYAAKLPEDLRMSRSRVVTGPYGDEAIEVFSVSNIRPDLFNASPSVISGGNAPIEPEIVDTTKNDRPLLEQLYPEEQQTAG
jgi:hypothetical protein